MKKQIMNMKKYMKPTVEVVNLEEESAILSGSLKLGSEVMQDQNAILKDGARGRNYEW